MRNPGNRQHRLIRSERGAQLAELAIVLPFFLFLFVAVAEFGRYFYAYTTLSKATRAGARYLTAKVYTDSEKDNAKEMVVYGTTTPSVDDQPIMSGLETADVQIISNGGTVFFPETITVKVVGYTYTPLFDLGKWTGGDPWQSVEVGPSTTMRYMLGN